MSPETTSSWPAWFPAGDPWMRALAPALLFCVFVGGAAIAYALRNRRGAAFQDEEMNDRGAGGLTTRGLRHFFAWIMRPIWRTLARVRFPPDVITKLSIAIAFGAAIAVAGGRFALGGWLFLGSGLLDFLDGRVARATEAATRRGAALDSVLDRYVEASFLTGLCWYYRHDWVLLPGLLALTGSLFVPYVRARGEALNVKLADVGFMQRTERVVVLGLGTALSPALDLFVGAHEPRPSYHLATVALVLLAVTSHVSAAQRLRRLLRALGEERKVDAGLRPVKCAAANAAATAVDFALAQVLFFGLSLHGSLATVVGCVAGALVSFTLSRRWAFHAGAGSLSLQLDRYVFASTATAALNAGGVALLSVVNAPFPLSWALTRAVVFACWSYPVQRDFVFAPGARVAEAHPGASATGFSAGPAGRAPAGAPH